ncbi:MAG: hypothetical protein WAU07_02960 [Microgenomates group bacterium]
MDENFKKDCEKIIIAIEKLGHTVYPKSLLKKTRDLYQQQTADEALREQKKLTEYKKNCGLVVIEASKPSLGLGQEIALSLLLEKPVLILHRKSCKPHILSDVNSHNLIVSEYNQYTIEKLLAHVIDYATDFQPYRLNIILSAKLRKYLEWISIHSGVTKSQFIRKLISKHLAENTIYHHSIPPLPLATSSPISYHKA